MTETSRLFAALVMMFALAVAWTALRRPIHAPTLAVQPLNHRLDLNRASPPMLALLPGLGAVSAKRLVDDRDLNGPFQSVAELQRVKGIGPKTIQRLEPFVFVQVNDLRLAERGPILETP